MDVTLKLNTKQLLLLLILPFLSIQQHRGFEPSTISVDRNWLIPESTSIGTIVKTVSVTGENNETILFTLELEDPFNPNMVNPFWIDPSTGYVYLNQSLEGKANRAFILSVGADDGNFNVKNQVRVMITGPNGVNTRKDYHPSKTDIPRLPSFDQLPSINRQPFPTTTKRPTTTFASSTKTEENDSDENVTVIQQNKTYIEISSTKTPVNVETSTLPNAADNGESVPLLTSPAILPILIAISSIFLMAALIAVVIFRKQICRKLSIGKKFSKSKVDKAKNSNQSGVSVITLSDDSRNSMVLHNWEGPIAYNNRYTPWTHDGVAYSSSSFSYVSGEAKVPGYDRWEFPRHRLKFFNILGEGAFGQVWRCEANDIDGVDGITTVAVKTLKENATESERKDLLSELQVMKSLEPHVNVVRLIGCCTDKDPVFVIIEFVVLGKLQTFLRSSRMDKNYSGVISGKSKTLTSHDLVSFMYQVARGMEFLSSRGIIHRDLAARNILLTEDFTCKIADFGFARDIETSTVYEKKTGGRQPIRWMAIESLYDNIFSVKSDVWSFGILMWEIATLGATPYPGMGAADVMKKIREGYRLEKPEHTSREIYNFMYYCWDSDPKARPDFGEIRQNLDKLLATAQDYIELERYPEHDYYNIIQNISGEKL